MARALHDDNVFTVGRAVEGPADTVLELGADDLGVLEIVLSELRSDATGDIAEIGISRLKSPSMSKVSSSTWSSPDWTMRWAMGLM